jgi:hypothetical protein
MRPKLASAIFVTALLAPSSFKVNAQISHAEGRSAATDSGPELALNSSTDSQAGVRDLLVRRRRGRDHCSTLKRLSSVSPLQITASDIAQYPFLENIGWCPAVDPINSTNGITCLGANLNTPTKMIFPLISYTGWCTNQNNPQQGYYWGRVIGADGIFFQGASLDQPVGYDTTSKPYQLAKQFQTYYAPWGASNNLYLINLEAGPLSFSGTEWYTPTWPARMVENVKEATALAKYAGFVGLAFNFERHDQFWDYDPSLPNKGQIIEQFGKDLGHAILSEFPTAQILTMGGCPTFQDPSTIPPTQRNLNGYYYYPEFCYGFVQSRFAEWGLGDEGTFNTNAAGDNPIPYYFAQFAYYYYPQLAALGVPTSQVTESPGFWPMGHPYKDPVTGKDVILPNGLLEYSKTATVNTTPNTWLAYIDSSFSFKQPFAYIFDLGWSYELTPNDPFQTGPLDPSFPSYINEFHAVKQKYAH